MRCRFRRKYEESLFNFIEKSNKMPSVNLILSDVSENQRIVECISKKYNFRVLKIADEIRQERNNGTHLWLNIAEAINNGRNINYADLRVIWKNAFGKIEQKDILLPSINVFSIDVMKEIIQEFGYEYGVAWRVKKKFPFYIKGNPNAIEQNTASGKRIMNYIEFIDNTHVMLEDVFEWITVDFDEFIQNNQ